MGQTIYNNVATTINGSILAADTNILVVNGELFPIPAVGEYYLATLVGYNSNNLESSWEIVKVTDRTSNTLTVERGQEGTTPQDWPNMTRFEMRITAGTVVMPDADQTLTNKTIDGGVVQNIQDLAIADGGTGASDAATARTNLGLGTIATQNANSASITGGSITGITDLAIADGGTGASTAAAARTNLGLGTAAEADVTQSATDTVSGRLLRVGNFGVGSTAPSVSGVDLDTINRGQLSQVYSSSAPAINGPSAEGLNLLSIGGGTRSSQLAIRTQAALSQNKIWFRGQATTWAPWDELYHTGNLLGTVSQSGGVPTGAVIESSPNFNSNGGYIRYADGTQICWQSFFAASGTWTYPKAFLAGSIVRVSGGGRTNSGQLADGPAVVNTGAVSETSVEYIFWRRIAGSWVQSSAGHGIIAFGRWF